MTEQDISSKHLHDGGFVSTGTEITKDNSPEILASREMFFEPVVLRTSKVGCGDKRPPVDSDETYIHLFGGALKPVHTLVVMKVSEALDIGQAPVITASFKEEAAATVPVVAAAGINVVVHSDTASEQGAHLHTEQAHGNIGCKYAQLRSQISQGIAGRGEEIITILNDKRPELLAEPEDQAFARRVIDAHGILGSSETFHGSISGREVGLAAVEHGAGTQVLDSEAVTGDDPTFIWNLNHGDALNNTRANAANLGSYSEDTPLELELFDEIRDRYPFDRRRYALASAIDTIGTALALGIKPENMAVRRAEAAA